MQNSLQCIINCSKTVAEQPVNVSASVSDVKIQNSTGGVTVDFYSADILSSQDYYAFGSLLDGGNFEGEGYRWGFNRMKKGDEVDVVSGNKLNFEARIYDSRLFGPRYMILQ